jgi:hypothetical protein
MSQEGLPATLVAFFLGILVVAAGLIAVVLTKIL